MAAAGNILSRSSRVASRSWNHLLSAIPLLGTLAFGAQGADFLLPDAPALKPHLQYWWKADALTLADGAPVQLWPDRSGHGRDLSPTKGVRVDGQGAPPVFVVQSTINKRPAIRFTPESGLATSPDNRPAITGDPALTITLVICLQPHEVGPPHDGVFGLGNPANPNRDPGRPLAALVQINRGEDHALHFAGGWNHDASLGKSSFKPHYGQPLLLTITKTPGSMKKTTTFFLNGEKAVQKVEGRDTKPDIQYRSDIGAYLGKAVNWAGSIRGDVSEIVVYNKALTDEERHAIESHLSDKYAILLKAQVAATRAKFKPEQRNWWAFQPVKKTALPSVKNDAWLRSDIDRFILAKQEASGLAPAPQADKRTLLRRATFDLTGLPPTPEEIDAFVKDESPDAFKKVVERLLASPHYGERWGRHWLDVVRYAETTANDANAVMRYAWRYRDYVVDAFNRDLPYDQFIIEQLAGDLLPLSTDIATQARRVIATGVLLLGPKALAETDKEQSRIDIVDDQLDTTGRAFLGLTVGCARCHDHKFDPIPTTDYYALAGIFRSTEAFMDEARNSSMWWQFPLFEIPGEKPFIVMAPKEALPRNLRVHKRGDRMKLGEVVPRGVLQVLSNGSPPIDTTQSGRLELARWMAARDNPLPARVMANRIWQHHFGTGLVATSDNFGVRGEAPSHPQLLDLLAANLMDNEWSVKSLHRLIMNSAVYQQATAKPGADARLLAGFARRKLSAEEPIRKKICFPL